MCDVLCCSFKWQKQKRWLPIETIILFVITLGRELATWFSRRGDSKAVNTEAQILLRIIYRQDCGEYGADAARSPFHTIITSDIEASFEFSYLASDIEVSPIRCP